MIVFPNCKINLGLNILGKRADGFHDLETIFYPLPLKDCLEIIPSTINDTTSPVTFSTSGLPVNGAATDNLCIKAYQLLKDDHLHLPHVKLHLHKAIPMGAGLGGGSADASFTLNLLNEKFKLAIPRQQLEKYALLLGSDCPFFLQNKPCLATGRGEILKKITVDLEGYQLVLVNPGIHINTAWAFSQLTPERHRTNRVSLNEVIAQPVNTWKTVMTNDFEAPVFAQYPEIKAIKDILYQNGAAYAAMSGSGSSIYGLFNNREHPIPDLDPGYFVQSISL